jgi:hypothetical protein
VSDGVAVSGGWAGRAGAAAAAGAGLGGRILGMARCTVRGHVICHTFYLSPRLHGESTAVHVHVPPRYRMGAVPQ